VHVAWVPVRRTFHLGPFFYFIEQQKLQEKRLQQFISYNLFEREMKPAGNLIVGGSFFLLEVAGTT